MANHRVIFLFKPRREEYLCVANQRRETTYVANQNARLEFKPLRKDYMYVCGQVQAKTSRVSVCVANNRASL